MQSGDAYKVLLSAPTQALEAKAQAQASRRVLAIVMRSARKERRPHANSSAPLPSSSASARSGSAPDPQTNQSSRTPRRPRQFRRPKRPQAWTAFLVAKSRGQDPHRVRRRCPRQPIHAKRVQAWTSPLVAKSKGQNRVSAPPQGWALSLWPAVYSVRRYNTALCNRGGPGNPLT